MTCENEIQINGETYIKKGTLTISKDVVLALGYKKQIEEGL